MGGPQDWQTVWVCQTTATSNAVQGGTTNGAAVVTTNDYQNTQPCSPNTTVDMTVQYTDAFGTMTYEVKAMPYAALTPPPPNTCETNWAAYTGPASFSGTAAYSGMSETCQFHVIGSNLVAEGISTGANDATQPTSTLTWSVDNEPNPAVPCSRTN